MEPSTVIQEFFTSIDVGLIDFFLGASGRLAGSLAGGVTNLLTLLIALWALGIMAGWVNWPIGDAIKRALIYSIVVTLALNSAVYSSHIAMMMYQWPDQLVSIVTGGEVVSVNAVIDSSVTRINDIAVGFKENASWSRPIDGLGYLLIALIVWIFGVAVCAYAASLILVAKMYLALVIAIGPIAILTAIAQPTRGYFFRWLDSGLTYGLQLVAIIFGINILFILWNTRLDITIATMDNGNGFANFIPALLIGIMGIILMRHAPFFARSLGGGWHGETHGMFFSTAAAIAVGARMAGRAAGAAAGRASAALARQ